MVIIWMLVTAVIVFTLYLILKSPVSRSERKAQALREWADVQTEVEAAQIRKETEVLRKQLETKGETNGQ